jgi:hypothetical protein
MYVSPLQNKGWLTAQHAQEACGSGDRDVGCCDTMLENQPEVSDIRLLLLRRRPVAERSSVAIYCIFSSSIDMFELVVSPY